MSTADTADRLAELAAVPVNKPPAAPDVTLNVSDDVKLSEPPTRVESVPPRRQRLSTTRVRAGGVEAPAR